MSQPVCVIASVLIRREHRRAVVAERDEGTTWQAAAGARGAIDAY